jgi:NAD(P)-dependent dehydrogenase (short-subunit alcohol dehydrogenase family)
VTEVANPLDMSGPVAVVVGAGGGIRKATALLLAKRKAPVLCLDRDMAAAQQTASAMPNGTPTAYVRPVRVTEPMSLSAAFATAVASCGQVHSDVNALASRASSAAAATR